MTRSGANEFRGSAYYWFRDNEPRGHRGEGPRLQPRHVRLPQLRRLAVRADHQGQAVLLRQLRERRVQPAGHDLPRQHGRRDGGGQHHPRARLRPRRAQQLPEDRTSATTPAPTRTTASRRRPSATSARSTTTSTTATRSALRYNQLDSQHRRAALELRRRSAFGQPPHQHDRPQLPELELPILENIKSGIGEWNSILGANAANSLIVGYTTRTRAARRADALPDGGHPRGVGTVYTTFGFEPFTPEQRAPLQHVPGAGQLHLEPLASTRSPSAAPSSATTRRTCSSRGRRASTSTTRSPTSTPTPTTTWRTRTARPRPSRCDASRCAGTTSPGSTSRPSRSTSGTPASTARTSGRSSHNLKIDLRPAPRRAVLRRHRLHERRTPTRSRSATRTATRSSTRRASCPTPSILWSPRVGFNWDVDGNRTTQVRGGTGVFTGRRLYVWISNQIGNTGVLTGFEQLRQHAHAAVQPQPRRLQAHERDGRAGHELRARAHRSRLQVPAGVAQQHRGRPPAALGDDRHGRVHLHARTSTASRTSTSTCPAAQTTFAGADTRPRWTSNRINANVANAIVLGNQNDGHSWNIAGLAPEVLPARAS